MGEEKKKAQKDSTKEFPFVCDICSRRFGSQGPLNLHRWQKHGITRAKGEIREPTGTDIQVQTAPVMLDVNEMAIANHLIQSGYAKDMRELIKKSIHMMFFRGGGIMPEEGLERKQVKEKDPFDELDEMQNKELKRKFFEKQLRKFESELEGDTKKAVGEGSDDDMVKSMQKELQVKRLQKALKDDSDLKDVLKDMMMFQAMGNVFGGRKDGEDVTALRQQIQQMQMQHQQQIQQMQMQQQMQLQNQQVLQKLAEFGNKKSMSAEDFMKIWADKEKIVKEKELEVQKERNKVAEMQMNDLKEKIEAVQAGGPLAEIERVRGTMKAVREISTELGDRSPGVMEHIRSAAEALTPAIGKAMDVAAAKARQPVIIQQPVAAQAAPASASVSAGKGAVTGLGRGGAKRVLPASVLKK